MDVYRASLEGIYIDLPVWSYMGVKGPKCMILVICSTCWLWRSLGIQDIFDCFLWHWVERDPTVFDIFAVSRQSVSVALQRAQTFSILCNAEAVSFRDSRQIPLLS